MPHNQIGRERRGQRRGHRGNWIGISRSDAADSNREQSAPQNHHCRRGQADQAIVTKGPAWGYSARQLAGGGNDAVANFLGRRLAAPGPAHGVFQRRIVKILFGVNIHRNRSPLFQQTPAKLYSTSFPEASATVRRDSAKRRRARCNRLITVPIGMLTASAISL